MKKVYVSPSASVVKIHYTQMLCDTSTENSNFDTTEEQEEIGVHNTTFSGDAL